jgi:hypothetical protein
MASLLHFVSDDEDPAAIVAQARDLRTRPYVVMTSSLADLCARAGSRELAAQGA